MQKYLHTIHRDVHKSTLITRFAFVPYFEHCERSINQTARHIVVLKLNFFAVQISDTRSGTLEPGTEHVPGEQPWP